MPSARTITLVVPIGPASGGGTLALPCSVEGGRVTRTLGLAGDDLTVRVRAADWPLPSGPEDANFARPFALVFSRTRPGFLPDESVTLEHYYLRQSDPEMIAAEHAGEPAGAAMNEMLVRLRFVTLPGYYRGDGRGALLRLRTFNPLLSSGEVDQEHPDYRTNVQLLNLCMDALGFELHTSPITMDDTPPPGPLDWGNANALHELEALLDRCGHAAGLPNSGNAIKVIELPRRADRVELDEDVEMALARPLKLSRAPGIRSDTIVVHSGATRTTVLTYRGLADLEWVWYSEEGHAWKNAAQTPSGEIRPDDIAAFRAGPPVGSDAASEARRAQYGRLFRALRLRRDGPDRGLRLVQAWEPVTFADGTKLGSCAAYIRARASAMVGPEVFVSVPVDRSAPRAPLGPCEVGPDAGVFVLPPAYVYVRPSPSVPNGQAYGRGDCVPLGGAGGDGDDLRVYFAHEADFPDWSDGGPLWGGHTMNYFVAAWRAAYVDDELTLTELTGEDLDRAVADPNTVKVAAPWLKRLVVYDPGDSAPTEVNLDALKAQALHVARRRASSALAEGGVAVCSGWLNKRPGDCGGAASAVTWDLDAFRTEITLNDHETPGGEMDVRAFEAHRSFAAGVSRFALPGTAVDVSELRAAGAPGVPATAAAMGRSASGGSPAAGHHPESAAATRGLAEVFVGGSAPMRYPGADGPAVRAGADTARFLARITGAVPVGPNRWSYAYAQVRVVSAGAGAGTVDPVADGWTHLTHGPAYNLYEADNDGSGVEGNGVNVGGLPAGWSLVPIPVGAVVVMEFNVRDLSGGCVLFARENAVDGQCAGAGGSLRGVADGNFVAMFDALWIGDDGLVQLDEDGVPFVGETSDGTVLSDSDRAALLAWWTDEDGNFITDEFGEYWLGGEDAEGTLASAESRAVFTPLMIDEDGNPWADEDHRLMTA